MSNITTKMKVADIVLKYPQTRSVLEGLGIDYCCGGKLTLKQSAEKSKLSVEDVVEPLKAAIEEDEDAKQYNDWSKTSLSELATHIEQRHHSFMKEQLPRLQRLLEKTLSSHNEKHGEMLKRLQETLLELSADIELHLAKEEQILFPVIKETEAFAGGRGPKPAIHCGSVENPINQMEYEHDTVGGILAKMREITSEYKLPYDACESFRALYDGLKELENDLHEHIHLENNILFPEAIKLESEIGL